MLVGLPNPTHAGRLTEPRRLTLRSRSQNRRTASPVVTVRFHERKGPRERAQGPALLSPTASPHKTRARRAASCAASASPEQRRSPAVPRQ
eukprot:3271909-Prymnesium_polylepis.1